MTLASAALMLFLILDPLGNVPVVLGLLRPLPRERRRAVLVREMLIALGVLMVFLWIGPSVLRLMHLDQQAVSIAGGIILFLIGIRMIFPVPEGIMGELPDGEPFIVPIAVPMVAGPSGMAAVMLLGTEDPAHQLQWSLALLLAWGGTAVILLSSTLLYRLLGMRVLTAVERLMGMLLVAISVQMCLDGIRQYLGAATGS
ncbi:YhgN family NAAT transporter [Solilutibacter silvestris]|uniref:YhgN family NAAT transporter n=1 Tax=Solilutibacter silvestris TaxID=1645665 RepID=UPI003D33463A